MVVMNLGRLKQHDERSRQFAFSSRAAESIQIKDKGWTHYGAVSDQGVTSACVGFTGLDWRNTRPAKQPKKVYYENTAFDDYRGATLHDAWPGEWPDVDNGSSGLGLCKYFKSIGVIDRYEWAFGFESFLHMMMRGPVSVGIEWTEGMFYPDKYGQISPTGRTVGGHQLLATSVDVNKQYGGGGRVWLLNHWSKRWGVNGRAWMTFTDFDNRLRADGDAVLMIKDPA